MKNAADSTHDAQGATASPVKPSGRTFAKKILVLVSAAVFIAGTVYILLHSAQIRELLGNVDDAKEWIHSHGVGKAAMLFIAANMALCAFGVPRMWTGVFAGVVFGGPLGLLLSLPSSLAGSYLTFAFLRTIGSHRILPRLIAKWGRMSFLAREPTFMHTVMLRQVPLPGLVATALLAASTIRTATFLVGSALGFVPAAVVSSFLGGGITAQHTANSIATTTLVVVIAIIVILAMRQRIGRPDNED